MSGHGSCSKLGCNCKSYSKSILTPGLCKSCNHVKDAHNQFIPDDDEDELPTNNQINVDLINPTNTTTSIDYSSDENDLNYSNHKKRKKKNYNNNNYNNNDNGHIHDNYPQQILKKKPTTQINHTESMWKNKYEQSQKEVEHWQTKYNNLYIKYKELLSQKQQTQSIQVKSGLNQSQSTMADIDLLSFTNMDNNNSNNNNNNGNSNNNNNSFAQWTTFD